VNPQQDVKPPVDFATGQKIGPNAVECTRPISSPARFVVNLRPAVKADLIEIMIEINQFLEQRRSEQIPICSETALQDYGFFPRHVHRVLSNFANDIQRQ